MNNKYEGKERRDDIQSILEVLESMNKPKEPVEADTKTLSINKNMPILGVVAVIIMGLGGFKTSTLAFADIKTNTGDISVLQKTLVSQPYVDNIEYRVNLEIGAVVSAIDDLKKTQNDYSRKLEKISDRQQSNSDKQQENFNSLKDLIIKTRVGN